MPVSPTPDESYYWQIVEAYQRAELEILQQIRDRLARGVTLDDQTWATQRLAEVQTMRRQAIATLAGVNRAQAGRITAALTNAYADGGLTALLDTEKYHRGRPTAVSSATRQASVGAVARELSGKLAEGMPAILRAAEDGYRSVVASVVQKVLAGGIDRRTATTQALQNAYGQGLRVGPGGRMSLPDYVTMAVRTGVAKAAIEGHTDTLGANGIDLVYILPGPRHCELCDDWANRPLWRVSGPTGEVQVDSVTDTGTRRVRVYGSLNDARAAGWGHPNCRCRVGAYLPGASQLPTPRDGQSAKDKREYEAQQVQRGIERKIREWKIRRTLTVDPVSDAKAAAKIKSWQEAQRAHLQANPYLKRQYDREQPSKVQPPEERKASDPNNVDFRSMTNAQKLEAARRMYGEDSAQFRAAQKRWAA
ncbi:minor capsid protein [Microbacterium phage Sucha]|nr:minor capsid protein [Microbacterium phage Sucha]